MPTRVPNPLLCLTASATLREKPVTTTPIRQALTALIEAAGGIPSSLDPSSPMKASGDEDDEDASDITGMEEINLLEGLTLGKSLLRRIDNILRGMLRVLQDRPLPSRSRRSFYLPLGLEPLCANKHLLCPQQALHPRHLLDQL